MVTHSTKLKYVCNVFREIIFTPLLPSCMSMWHFALLGKLLKLWVTFLGGRGVNSRMYVRTREAASVGLTSPLLRALEYLPQSLSGCHLKDSMESPPAMSLTGEGFVVGDACSRACRSTHIPLCTRVRGASMFYGALAREDWAGICELWHMPKDHCATFCCGLFDSWDPTVLDFYLCDSSLSVAAFASHFVHFLFVCLFAFV